MDIQRAKEEIKRAVQAYLATDDIGRPLIPAVRQRPILLMGPPGVGKTQIMEQIAQECDIALVAYTFMKGPENYQNVDGKEVPVMHTGKSGVRVGRLNLTLKRK